MARPYSTSAYRYPNEQLILAATLVAAVVIIAVTATATVCTSVIFIGLFVAYAAYANRAHHQRLMQLAMRVTPQRSPALTEITNQCIARLQPGQVQVYLVSSDNLNAYTFGLDKPNVVVIYSALLKIMDREELKFIIGHELGHVRLGHTWLNSLAGGLAGIPSPISAAALLALALRSWNRACEYSADRAGLLACGNPEKAITALIKLVAGPQGLSRKGLELAYHQIDAEDDSIMGSLGELLDTHPMLIRRINQLRAYARSAAYRNLQSRIAQNDTYGKA